MSEQKPLEEPVAEIDTNPVKHEEIEEPKDKQVVFEVDRESFKTFLEAANCRGVLSVDNEKVKSGDLFANLLLQVTEEGIIIKGTDTKSAKVIAQHLYKAKSEKVPKGVVVISQGDIPVTSVSDMLKAISHCTGGKDDTMIVMYPYAGEKCIFVGKKGTETGWSFPSKGKKDVTSLEKTDRINHVWDPKEMRVVSTSSKTGQVFKWKNKIIVLPEEVTQVASDMSSFIKQKTVSLVIDGNKMIFSLGDVNSSRKGKRQLLDISRQVWVESKEQGKPDKGWMQVTETDKTDVVTSQFFHGFYAVLQNIPMKNVLEMHFQEFEKGKSMCWVRSYNMTTELHFLIPFETDKK